MNRAVESIYCGFKPLLDVNEQDFELMGSEKLPFPSFTCQHVQELLDVAIPIFQQMPNVLSLTGDIFIVGDIHGNLRDLLRILVCGRELGRFLFLGDYVDRGEYSVEVICLLLALAVMNPQKIFLLRGNHEFESVNAAYGFKEQILGMFGSTAIYEKFQILFSHLPIAAVVNDTTFCVHGGLSPLLNSVKELDHLDRTAEEPSHVMIDIMWSDPTPKSILFLDSFRGKGCEFGSSAVVKFLRDNNLKRIIRAHQFVQSGLSSFAEGKLLTVFSTSSYKFPGSNHCGLIRLWTDEDRVQGFNLPDIPVLPRENASFTRVSGLDSRGVLATRIASLRLENLNRRHPIMLPKLKTGRTIRDQRKGSVPTIARPCQAFLNPAVRIPSRGKLIGQAC